MENQDMVYCVIISGLCFNLLSSDEHFFDLHWKAATPNFIEQQAAVPNL